MTRRDFGKYFSVASLLTVFARVFSFGAISKVTNNVPVGSTGGWPHWFIDVKDGKYIPGNEVREFWDWYEQPTRFRYVRIQYQDLPLTSYQWPRGKRALFTCYLDSQLKSCDYEVVEGVGFDGKKCFSVNRGPENYAILDTYIQAQQRVNELKLLPYEKMDEALKNNWCKELT